MPAICKVIQSKHKISSEREGDESLADNQREVAYADELDEYYQNRRVSDAHAEERQVTRRLCVANASCLENDVNIQGDVREEREQVQKRHVEIQVGSRRLTSVTPAENREMPWGADAPISITHKLNYYCAGGWDVDVRVTPPREELRRLRRPMAKVVDR